MGSQNKMYVLNTLLVAATIRKIASLDPTPYGDLAIIVLGGEGPDGLLDTVDVLTTEQGWCPEDKVRIPKLPMAAGNLTAHYGPDYASASGFLAVCGFPGDHACFHISPGNGHMEWQPVLNQYEELDLSEHEYISSTESHQRKGMSGLFRRKNDGSFRMLWNPLGDNGEEAPNRMTGWMDYNLDGADDVQYPPLSGDPFAACLGSFVMPNGMPCAQVLSGGFVEGETTNNMSIWLTSCYGSEIADAWVPSDTGSLVPRSYHHCRKFDWFDTNGLLLVGGWEPIFGQSLSSMEFLVSEPPYFSLQLSTFLPEMNAGRHSFGLAHFNAPSADGDLNQNHQEYMVALGGVGDHGEILSSVEIFADPDQFPYAPAWFLKPDWEMKTARKGFAAVANGAGSLVNRYDFCDSF